MKLKYLILSLFTASVLLCQAQQMDPITKAMLDGNTEWLKDNPNDYEALFERAAIYLQLHRLDEAYLDIVKAIDNTPAKEKDALNRNFSLLADILAARDNLPKAVEAINKALEIDPSSYANIYKKGNYYLRLNMPDEAYNTFSSLQRIKSRSPEAFFGMARAKAMKGEMDDARDLIKEVEQADPTNYLTYIRIGDFYESINQNPEAAANYLLAFTLTDTSSTPMNSLMRLGMKDYPSVNAALTNAATKTRNTIPLDFMLANIAYRAGEYGDSFQAYSRLMASPEGNDPDILAGFARSALALNKIPDAQTAIANALKTAENADLYILKSKIQRAASLPTEALAAANKALELKSGDTNALIEVALNNIALKNYNEAIAPLSEAIMTNADDPMPLLLRGYVYTTGLKDQKKGAADYSRASSINSDGFPEIALEAMAKSLSGKKMDGDAMIEKALTKDSGKNAAYWAAVYYAQTGNPEKAKEWKDKAVALGYSNLFNLELNKDANLTIAPIR